MSSTAQNGSCKAGSYTHVGRVRDHNEDAFLSDLEAQLFIVADGMGGHSAGEVASGLAIESIAAAVRAGQAPAEAIEAAQRAIEAAIEQEDGPEGMGTTVVLARMDGSRYEIAWVGDSRAYLWYDGGLRQLTHDHSYVQQLVDQDAISQEEAAQHPERSTLTRCLGGGVTDRLEVDTVSGTLFAGERLVLCSDGVSSEIDDATIAECLGKVREELPAKAARALVERAVDAGGSDNATAVIVDAATDAPRRMQQTAPRPALPGGSPNARFRRSTIVLLSLIPAALLVLALFWYGLQDNDTPTSGPVQLPGPAAPISNEPSDVEEAPDVWQSGFEEGEQDDEASLQEG